MARRSRPPVAARPIDLPSLIGSQKPTHLLVPPHKWTRGHDVLAMAELVGITLDPWQRQLLLDALGVETITWGGRPVERWTSFEVVVEIARQNGKSVVLDVLALTALYVWRLKKIVYSAHEGLTAMEAYGRLEELIRGCPELRAETPDRSFVQSNGKEKIRLPGQELIFKTRTPGAGRGLSGDLVILDEAQGLTEPHIKALFPTLRARPNPQVWYAGSAGDESSTVLGRLIRRSEAKEPKLCVCRFVADELDDPADPRTWVKVTPALGRRIDPEWMANEQRSMSAAAFAQELLNIGSYPREDGEEWVIPRTSVTATTAETSYPLGRLTLVADAKLDQSAAAIAIAGGAGLQLTTGKVIPRPGGGVHVEVIEHLPGVRWLPDYLKALVDRNPDLDGEVALDGKGPLARMKPDLEAMGLRVKLLTSHEVVEACGWTYDAAVNEPRQWWHRGGRALTSAVAAASSIIVGAASRPAITAGFTAPLAASTPRSRR